MRLRTLLPPSSIVALVLLATGLASTAFGQLLYTANYGTSNLSEFTTNAGPLSGLSCLPYNPASPTNTISTAPGANPEGLAMTPNGSYLYTADNGAGGGISAYSVGASGCVGKLTALPSGAGCPATSGETCPSYTLGGGPWGIAVDPSGKYLYVALNGDSQVAAFSISSTTGALTLIGTYATASNPSPLVVASVGSNEYLYVGLNSQVAVYPITGTGALGSATTYNINGGAGSPTGLATFGTTLYVVDNNSAGSAGLYAFPILGTGLLGNPATATTGEGPFSVAVDASGTYVYVVDDGDNAVYSFLAGNLAANPTSLILGSGGVPYGVTVDPTNNVVYVSDHNNSEVWAYTPGLAASVSGSPFSVGANTAPGQFLLAHVAPPVPPASPTIPAASYTSLVLLGILLAGCAGLMYRKSTRASSLQ
jgi:DNA-binding beta-propeller fold protein YncE